MTVAGTSWRLAGSNRRVEATRMVDYDDWFVREVEKGLAQIGRSSVAKL